MSVDIENDRIEIEVIAWGIGEESRSLDYRIKSDTYLFYIFHFLLNGCRGEVMNLSFTFDSRLR